MRRLSTIFLLCFLGLLVGFGGLIAWKVAGRRAPAPPREPTQQADYQIKEIHIDETLEGNLRWTLDAAQAHVYEDRRVTVMKQVVVKVFSREGTWTVTADEGTLDNQKKDVTLEGNVVVTSSDGLRMTTTTLSWLHEGRRLSTDAPVEIVRAGTTIHGRGLDVRMQEERAALGGKVRVVITDRSKSSLALFPRSGS
jgi:LPS export ABC transporter protein LptC